VVNALAGEVPNNSGQWSSQARYVGSGEDGQLSVRGLSPLMNGITVDGMNGKLAFRGVSAPPRATALQR